MDAMSCEDIIYSNDYGDYIIETLAHPNGVVEFYGAECIQVVNPRVMVIHRRIQGNPEASLNVYGYTTMPKCYGIMDTTSVEATGVLQLRRQPYLSLYGQDILIGVVDTGECVIIVSGQQLRGEAV